MDLIRLLIASMAFLFTGTVLTHSSQVGIQFPPEALQALANEVPHLQPSEPRLPLAGWRWDAPWPEARMRAVDLTISPAGELWFAWVKFKGELWQDWKPSLFLSTPARITRLRDTQDCVIADASVAVDAVGGAAVMWREVIPIGPKSDLLLARIGPDGSLLWGPVLVDHQIREAAIVLDGQGGVAVVGSPGNPSESAGVSLPREHFYYRVSQRGELTAKDPLGKLAGPYGITLARTVEGRSYFSWMNTQVRYVAQIEETADGPKLSESHKMLAPPQSGLRDNSYFGDNEVLRARAFFDEDGTLLVDNLVWSSKEQRWKVIRVEYKPNDPVPGSPTPTIFVDPEGGLHINPP